MDVEQGNKFTLKLNCLHLNNKLNFFLLKINNMVIQVDEHINLEILEEEQAETLCELVNENRDHLRQWLPWVDHMQTAEQFKLHIIETKKQATEKTNFGFAIFIDKKLVGKIGIHHINTQNNVGQIGYWLAADQQKKGVIFKCCNALLHFGFSHLDLNRIEIKCGTGNNKSKAIPEKLHFTFEGILRQAEQVNGKYIDLFLYSMIKTDWENNKY